jgi:putative hydrolase of the HAD superfamily
VDYVRSGYRAVGRWAADMWAASPDEVEQELWDIFCSEDRSRVFNKWLRATHQEEYVRAAVDVYREHRPGISLVPGATEVLRGLGEHFRLGLVTDGYPGTQRRKIEALGIEDLISTIIISDEIGGRAAWKPSPAPFLEACARLGTKPSRAVYIGDNPHKDFLGARAAGLTSVRLRLSAGLHFSCEPQHKGDEPDITVFHVQEIPRAIDTLTPGASRFQGVR